MFHSLPAPLNADRVVLAVLNAAGQECAVDVSGHQRIAAAQ